jgi:hypothetical protein
VRLNWIDELFDWSIFQKKQVMFFLNIANHCVDWFVHQNFFIHVSYKILLFKTSYEHQNNICKWHISDVVEEHFSIFFVDAINDEHDFIFFDQHKIVWYIDHFVRRRYFIYELIQIINKWIITIKIVNNASSKKIVKRFINRQISIFWWFSTCHICKFNIWDIIICCFFTVRFLVIVVFFFRFALFCFDVIQNVNVNNSLKCIKKWSWFQNRIFYSFFFCWLHFQFDDLINLTMCSQFFQSCMTLHTHCRFSLLSFSDEIENVDFCDWDWDCDWFWRVTALTCSTIFKFFLTAFLYSRIVSAKWTFLSIAFFCKIQLSQNVEAHFRSTIKNSSTNIVSKSKKFLMSKVKMRFLRFSQSATQISIWFLNDDCFNVWNFSCNCFFIWSSIFLYLMIKNCNISLMKIDIISKKIYDLAKTRIASFILNIFWEILTINFFFRLYSFTLAL